MYATATLHDRYKSDSVNTASALDLIIMLYDGCIKQIKFARLHMEDGDIQKTHNALSKAQDIIDELMRSLDMGVEMSQDLLKLYEFLFDELVQINITKDMDRAEPVISMLTELRDAWKGAKAQVGTQMYLEEE